MEKISRLHSKFVHNESFDPMLMPDQLYRLFFDRLRTLPKSVVLLLMVVIAAGALLLVLGPGSTLNTVLVVFVMVVCAALLWLRFLDANFTLHRAVHVLGNLVCKVEVLCYGFAVNLKDCRHGGYGDRGA